MGRWTKLVRPAVDEESPIWLTVYADLMTNLMLFFLMMFALNIIGKARMDKVGEAFRQHMERRPAEPAPDAARQPLNEFLRNIADKEKDVQIIRQGEGVRLRLPEPILFDSGEAALKPEGEAVLGEIADGLRKLPNGIVVEGHTDDIPVRRLAYKSNWELSEARAENVVTHLSTREGLDPRRLAVAAYGEHRPFAPNRTPLDRALNRRIELVVIVDEDKAH